VLALILSTASAYSSRTTMAVTGNPLPKPLPRKHAEKELPLLKPRHPDCSKN
jgi:hypothetical protein